MYLRPGYQTRRPVLNDALHFKSRRLFCQDHQAILSLVVIDLSSTPCARSSNRRRTQLREMLSLPCRCFPVTVQQVGTISGPVTETVFVQSPALVPRSLLTHATQPIFSRELLLHYRTIFGGRALLLHLLGGKGGGGWGAVFMMLLRYGHWVSSQRRIMNGEGERASFVTKL